MVGLLVAVDADGAFHFVDNFFTGGCGKRRFGVILGVFASSYYFKGGAFEILSLHLTRHT